MHTITRAAHKSVGSNHTRAALEPVAGRTSSPACRGERLGQHGSAGCPSAHHSYSPGSFGHQRSAPCCIASRRPARGVTTCNKLLLLLLLLLLHNGPLRVNTSHTQWPAVCTGTLPRGIDSLVAAAPA